MKNKIGKEGKMSQAQRVTQVSEEKSKLANEIIKTSSVNPDIELYLTEITDAITRISGLNSDGLLNYHGPSKEEIWSHISMF